jgi:hypothetical protein
MYKILFIDEQQEDIDQFKDYVDATSKPGTVEVVAEYPLESLEEMIDEIFKSGPDAVITDFMLNDYKEHVTYNVPYNGVQLVRELTSIREGFPCFVITSFDDQAVNESDDVNIVYIKDILHNAERDTKAKANFLERVEIQIENYKSKIQDAEEELLRLVELRNSGKANMDDESEIIRLDHLLEVTTDKKHSIPEEYKTLSNNKRLEELMSKVDELITKIE